MASAIYVCLCHGAPISQPTPNHHCTRECGAGIHYDFCVVCQIKLLDYWTTGTITKVPDRIGGGDA